MRFVVFLGFGCLWLASSAYAAEPNVTLLKPAFDAKTMGTLSDSGQLTIKCDLVVPTDGQDATTRFMASILRAVCEGKVTLQSK